MLVMRANAIMPEGGLLGRPFRNVMMVMRKETLKKKHRQESSQNPKHGLMQRAVLFSGVWNKVQCGYAQHKSRNKTHRRLQPSVGKTHSQQRPNHPPTKLEIPTRNRQ